KRTGSHRLRLDEVFHGLALQLLAYLLVLKDQAALGADVQPAGAFYLPITSAFQRVEHPSKAGEPDFDAFKHLRPRGIVDFDAIAALDPGSDGGGWSKLYAAFRSKDGMAGNLHNSDAVLSRDIEPLLKFVRIKIGQLADRLLSGEISVRPVRLGKVLSCDRCE